MEEENRHLAEKAFLNSDSAKSKSNAISIPSINLPKGGGAVKSIDEKFSVNAVNGTASFSISLPFSSARGASPKLSLSYNSGGGNGIFGLGWSLDLASIKRKTDKQLPQYFDSIESDIFLFSQTEDLVPEFKKESNGSFSLDIKGDYFINETDSSDGLYKIRFYKPRIEGMFSRIERWTEKASGIIKWRIITRDNYTTLFGWSSDSVIADPDDNKKIFQWLPEFSFDDKGNCCRYIYKREDEKGFNISALHNRNRLVNGRLTYTNLYLEKVLYGNKDPYKKFGDDFPAENNFMFQTVFDYGEYDTKSPYSEMNNWDFRADAFSEYKAGFEIRTTRLCKRVMLFHFFDELPGGSALISSIDLEYDSSSVPNFTFLKSITSSGYIKKTDGTYTSKNLPAIEFEYQKPDWNKEVKNILQEELVNAPSGLGGNYQFTDLFNEGLSGILTEQADGWYYKHNLGGGKFEQAKLVTPKPSTSGLGEKMHLVDLDADGGKQLVSYATEQKGYFELDDHNEWQPFRSFGNLPNINFVDADMRMLDLNGDGRPEILITEDNVFAWYESDGRNGFSRIYKTEKPFDEEAGPFIVFADEKQTIFLADMTGDGMSDIVRIRNGDTCYWPNLGYGKFGSKVAMENAPLFDSPDIFNPNLLKMADIDGSGTADIIYLGKDRFTCWMNYSGNSFAVVPFEIDSFPDIYDGITVSVTDLLGNGVPCIVWSCVLQKDSGFPLRYIDLMNGKKPHLMTSYKNNLGKEVYLEYTPSTKFYIEDKLGGKPWITKLHFPVHCISRIETVDKISGWHFVSLYKYHHGYYDHPEREFRGFGMVEHTDTESFENWVKSGATNITEKDLHQEPVLSKTWFHTGIYLDREKILKQFEHEYWHEEMHKQGFTVSNVEKSLPDARITVAPGIPQSVLENFSAVELREALRACKSLALHSEIFALDAPAVNPTTDEIKKQLSPFSVAEHNCIVELLQPKGQNKYAVFTVKESEAVNYSYERNTGDPRVAHNLNIKIDELGNVLEAASVVYPRLKPDTSLPDTTKKEQDKTVIIYTQNKFTNDISGNDVFRLRLPSETKTFELKGISKNGPFFSVSDFENILNTAAEVPYNKIDSEPSHGTSQKRLIEHVRTNFLHNDLSGPLQLNKIESLAIPYENYQLAYTPGLITDIYGTKVDDSLMTEGKFTHSEGDDNWWISSGTIQFIQGTETSVDAQKRFYLPVSYTDPFGSMTKVKYYGNYNLFINETEDALGNKTKVDLFNFRTLSPQRMKDINGNLSEAISDELGLVKAVAMFGKGSEADDLTGFTEFTDQAESDLTNQFFNVPLTAEGVADSKTLDEKANLLLLHSTSRFLYDFDVYKKSGKPSVIAKIIREEHYQKNKNSYLQLSFEYSSGTGKVIMKKAQAEPGLAKKAVIGTDGNYTVEEIDTSGLNPSQLRWIGTGRTILNNKGNPVKQYEPYFSVNNLFEDIKELVETGVTPVMYYDALGRLIKTGLPNGTLSRVEFDSWKQSIFDPNDTVLESSWYNDRINHLIDAELISEGKNPAREKAAAEKAAKHANTPAVLHFNTLGRPVLSSAHNKNIATGTDEFYLTEVFRDTEGDLRSVTDARGNVVTQFKYDLLGNKVYQNSMDAGQRWLLINVLGNPLRTWDERNDEFQYFYDEAHRPLNSKIIGGDGTVPLNNIFERIIYGESLLLPDRSNEAALQTINVMGRPVKHFDTGGVILSPEFDFKGQPKNITQKLFKGYKSVPDWSDANLGIDLESEGFVTSAETDALGRITKQTAPDGSILTPTYNRTGLINGENVVMNNPALTADYITGIDYDEKGRRNKITYGNNVASIFYYDKETFLLNRIETKRQNNDPLQDLYFTYDPVGNIVFIEDKDIPVVFFDNQKVDGLSEYTYDAVYRLVEATGRENNAALTFDSKDNWNDAPFIHQLNQGDSMAVRNYTQNYQYDGAGNILQMKQQSSGNNWTRKYKYETNNNRLKTTQVGAQTYNYTYHPQHGFITVMPHLEEMDWNFKEELVKSIRQKVNNGNGTPETTYYQYDGQGQRIRKITENSAKQGGSPSKKEERIYIGSYEIYHTYKANTVDFERESLSLMEGPHRFVMIETVKQNTDNAPDPSEAVGARLTRYQFHNQIGSAVLELDDTARIISYEEYHPFGTTAYQANSAVIKAAAKRYRYTGMERDEETGLEYHSARYYLPWIGKWLSADSAGIKSSLNLYAYCADNPIDLVDLTGLDFGTGSTQRDEQIYKNLRWLYNYIYFGKHYPTRGQVVGTIKAAGGYDLLKQYGFDDDFWLKQNKRTRASFKAAFEKYQKDFISHYGADVAAHLGGPDYVARVKPFTREDAIKMLAYEKQKEIIKQRVLQFQAVSQSPILAGISMAIARQFTKDERKITAAGFIGVITGNLSGISAQTYTKYKLIKLRASGTGLGSNNSNESEDSSSNDSTSSGSTAARPSISGQKDQFGMYWYEWSGGGRASFKIEGDTVILDYLNRGGAPKGSGGAMLAEALQKAGISKPTVLFGPNILPKAENSAQVIENGLRDTVRELGGTVTKITFGTDAGKQWIKINIKY